jgi:hypothetical protein
MIAGTVSGIVLCFESDEGWGDNGKPQPVFYRGGPQDKAERRGKQDNAPQSLKQIAGGFQLQAHGTGFPGVGMAKVGKDEAPRKNGGKDYTGRQKNKWKSFLRQPNHSVIIIGKNPFVQPQQWPGVSRLCPCVSRLRPWVSRLCSCI